MNALPFAVDRTSRIKLPHQVADGLRRAIVAGCWAAGESLPSSRDLAERLGVSLRVTKEALRILSAERSVALRARSGATVNAPKDNFRSRRILLVLPGGFGNVNSAQLLERVAVRLGAAGYLVHIEPVFRLNGEFRFDVTQLKGELRQDYRLAVLPYMEGDVLRTVEGSNLPFVVLAGPKSRSPRCVGAVALDDSAALAKFVGHCRRKGVRSVLRVSKFPRDRLAAEELKQTGVPAKTWLIPAKVGPHRAENIEFAAFRAFARRLARQGTSWLPELLFFTDDYACAGALSALQTAGVRVPDDVCVVSVANRGRLRAYAFSLARIEYDYAAWGAVAGDAVVDYLRTGVFPAASSVGPIYRKGESFG